MKKVLSKVINRISLEKKEKKHLPFSISINALKMYVGLIQVETESAQVKLEKESFEKYMEDYKPYLNSKLSMEDLANELNTNRTYLSGFIKKTYGMGFRSFVNSYRLSEYEKQLNDPKCQTMSNMELVIMSGFGSYRNFIRIHKKETSIE